ncbi:hypothetical protein FRC08_018874, partial [Ceratobasidium sp. 394]
MDSRPDEAENDPDETEEERRNWAVIARHSHFMIQYIERLAFTYLVNRTIGGRMCLRYTMPNADHEGHRLPTTK